MQEGSFTTTYSLKVKVILVFFTGTIVAPSRGSTFLITGGMVSLGPPEGGVVVLAQEFENKSPHSVAPTDTTGNILVNNSLNICFQVICHKFLRITFCIPSIFWSILSNLSRSAFSCTIKSISPLKMES